MLTKKNSSLKWLISIILLISGGLTIWYSTKWLESPKAESSEQRKFPPRPVEIEKLTNGEAIRKLSLLGQVEASNRATIRSQVDGIVEQVMVKVGDRVTVGQSLAQLDNRDQQLAVLEAQARLAQEQSRLDRLEIGTRNEIINQRKAELAAALAREEEAEDNLRRISQLTQQGALSERDLVQAQTSAMATRNERLRLEALLSEAETGPTPEEIAAQRAVVQSAAVAVEQAQLDLERTTITADFSGVVQSRQVNPGDYVESSDALITLMNNETLDIYVEVPERLIGQIEPGQIVELTTRALPDWQQKAQVEAVVQATEAATRRQIVRLAIDNPPSGLLPGMAVQANLELSVGDDEEMFVVSRDALTKKDDQWFIFIVEENQAKQYAVEVKSDMGEQIAISNPQLQAGQQIVTTGSEGLRDGADVKIVSP